MSLTATLPAAIIETVLLRLAGLFLTGAGGDMAAARHAASQMLDGYHPQTEDELRLAANIIGFSFQALEALAQAAEPDMPLTRVLRLRGGAVSLSNVAAKAERRLGQLQKAREQGILAQPAAIQPQPEARAEKAIALIEETATIAVAAKTRDQTWTQAYEQRQRNTRIAASLQKAEARSAAQAAAAIQRPVPDHLAEAIAAGR